MTALRVLTVALLLFPLRTLAAPQIVEGDIRLALPADDCSVAATATRLLVAANQPGGVEYVPGACQSSVRRSTPPPDFVSFQGMSIDDALDRLVSLGPTYERREENGVIVVRPVVAWRNTAHFLRRVVGTFELDQATIATALTGLQTALGPWTFGGTPSPQATAGSTLPFSVSLLMPSVLDALNAVVRAHGGLVWEVSYCGPHVQYELATIWLTTYEGVGVSGHAIFLNDAEGRRIDPCANRSRK
jgi:hypothetical protein